MEDKDSRQISQQEVDVWYIQEQRTGGGDEFSESPESCHIKHRRGQHWASVHPPDQGAQELF